MKVGSRVKMRSEEYPEGFLRKGEAVVIGGPGSSGVVALRQFRHWHVRFPDGHVGYYPEPFLEAVVA